MAAHSPILAWEIPWTEEPGKLQSMGSQKSLTQWLNNNPKVIREKKIIKIRAEIKEIKTRKTTGRVSEIKGWCFEEVKNWQTFC